MRKLIFSCNDSFIENNFLGILFSSRFHMFLSTIFKEFVEGLGLVNLKLRLRGKQRLFVLVMNVTNVLKVSCSPRVKFLTDCK